MANYLVRFYNEKTGSGRTHEVHPVCPAVALEMPFEIVGILSASVSAVRRRTKSTSR
jgi:hypothetical protein